MADKQRHSLSEFVSVGTSWDGRWQALAVMTGSMELISLVGFGALGLAAAMIRKGRVGTAVVASYLGWALCVDDSAFKPRRRKWLSEIKWWRHYADYFPLTLVKTASIDPAGRYVFGYHPHGVISVGALGSFAMEGARTLDLSGAKDGKGGEVEASTSRRGFTALFPGIEARLVTLAVNFKIPLVREYFLSLGAMAADKKAFRSVLKGPPGSAIAVVVGGAEESTETRQGSITLVLEKRHGFIREAMLAGAKPVPVLAFGENDIYDVKWFPEGHWARNLQDQMRKRAGFTMPIFSGRSVFVKAFGVMPMRRPIWVVVGAPIEYERIEGFDSKNPEHSKAVEEVHARYVHAVERLYEDYKDHPLQPYRRSDEAQPNDGRKHFTRMNSRLDSDGDKIGGLTIAN